MRTRTMAMLAALAIVSLASPEIQAGGRVAFGVGVGVPGPYYRPVYYPRPYYYAPYPIVYVAPPAPRAVYVVPAGPQPVYVQPGVYQAPAYAMPVPVTAPAPVPTAGPQQMIPAAYPPAAVPAPVPQPAPTPLPTTNPG